MSGIRQGTGGGEIVIQNNASLQVDAAIFSGGGSLTLNADSGLGTADLMLNAQISTSLTTGEILLQAERDLFLNDTGEFVDFLGASIRSEAGGNIAVADEVIIQSRTGAVINSVPLLQNIVTPQVEATGEASVSGDFGRLNELNFYITVDWADGVVETYQQERRRQAVFSIFIVTTATPILKTQPLRFRSPFRSLMMKISASGKTARK